MPISANVSRPIVLAIAGGSGSGKSTVAVRVQERFPEHTVEILHHDAYYRDQAQLDDEQRARINFDHPAAFETELLVEHLDQLCAGRSVAKPQYDYGTHRRLPTTLEVEPAEIIFVEGILVLENPELRQRTDIRLYVDVDSDERLMRRIRRDVEKRGRSLADVVQQYRETVRPMHQQFVEPSKRYAHMIIPEGGHNKVAIDMICAKLRDILQQRQTLRSS